MSKKPQMAERDIAARLINWGLCQRGRSGGSMMTRETRRVSPYGGQGYQCMTAVVIARLREAANGPTGGTYTQSKLDFTDAEAISKAWSLLEVRPKMLLRDFYVLERPVNVICRELDIRHWPASHWNRELVAAQSAIKELLDKRIIQVQYSQQQPISVKKHDAAGSLTGAIVVS